jgi:hypothetical protein
MTACAADVRRTLDMLPAPTGRLGCAEAESLAAQYVRMAALYATNHQGSRRGGSWVWVPDSERSGVADDS